MKLTANNITLDLSGMNDFPHEIQEIFEKIGRIDQLSLNRATINTSYNSSKQFRFSIDGMTSLANIKILTIDSILLIFRPNTLEHNIFNLYSYIQIIMFVNRFLSCSYCGKHDVVN